MKSAQFNSSTNLVDVMPTGPNVIKLFTAIIYDFLYARVFFPGKPFQLSLMFASVAGAYLSGAPFKVSTLKVFY